MNYQIFNEKVVRIMTVNRSGDLSVEYFLAYFRLVMNSRLFDVEETYGYIFRSFFASDSTYRGDTTFERFQQSFGQIKDGS